MHHKKKRSGSTIEGRTQRGKKGDRVDGWELQMREGMMMMIVIGDKNESGQTKQIGRPGFTWVGAIITPTTPHHSYQKIFLSAFSFIIIYK